MEIVFVVAIAENGVIGAGNAIPWALFGAFFISRTQNESR